MACCRVIYQVSNKYQRAISTQRCRFFIFIVAMRWFYNYLIFIVGISSHRKMVFILTQGPGYCISFKTKRKQNYQRPENRTTMVYQWLSLSNNSILGPVTTGSASAQGQGLLKLHSLISPLAKYLILQKHLLDYLNHIYIWQVPPQLSCGDTCQI